MEFEEERPAQQTEPKGNSSSAWELYTILHDLAWALAIIALIFTFVVRLVGVSGSSMYSTFVDKDFLLLEGNVLYQTPKQGDVVVLNVPTDAVSGPIVKRVIATEGQTVDIDFDRVQVFVDGEPLDEPYTYEPTYNSFGTMGLDYPVTVPEGSVFVMGDNRNNSLDSRAAAIGCVDKSRILGRALFILFPGRWTDNFGNVIGGRDFSRIGAVS